MISNKAINALLSYLLNHKIFNRHTPEDKLINSKTKWLDKEEKKDFEEQYKWLINEQILLRQKKKQAKDLAGTLD